MRTKEELQDDIAHERIEIRKSLIALRAEIDRAVTRLDSGKMPLTIDNVQHNINDRIKRTTLLEDILK